MRDHFIKRLRDLAARDPRIVLITGDLGFKVFDEYRATLPEQFINAGVSEQNMTALATGMAMSGKVVFTYSIGNFSTLRCLEQIRNDACYHDANVKVVSVGGGFSYGALGISHHATEDLAIVRSLPDVTVVCPSTQAETSAATEAIVRQPGTCYLRLDKSHGVEPSAEIPFDLGKGRFLKHGRDCTFIVAGGILGEVQEAVQVLEERGISCGILSLHTLRPLDADAILSAAEARAIVTVEEHTLHGGLGSAVAEVLMDRGRSPGRFLRIGLDAGFSCIVGSQKYLRMRYGLDSEAICRRAAALLSEATGEVGDEATP